MFSDGFLDRETQRAIKLARMQMQNQALAQAMDYETMKESVQGHVRAVQGYVVEDRLSTLEEMMAEWFNHTKARDH